MPSLQMPEEETIDYIERMRHHAKWGWLYRLLKRPKFWLGVGLVFGLWAGAIVGVVWFG